MKRILLILSIFLLFLSCEKKEKDIKIGIIISETGSAAQYGEWTKNGIELAFKEFLDNEEIDQNIKLIYEDDQTNPAKAVSIIKKLKDLNDVNIVIGPITSSSVLSVAPIAEMDSILLITPCASNPKISNAGEYIFRNWPSDELEGRIMANFIKDSLKMSSVAIVALNNEYGLGLRDVFYEEANKIGLEIIIDEKIEQDQRDFRTLILKCKGKSPSAIYIPGHAKESAYFIKQSSELGFSPQFTSSVAFGSPEVFEVGGKAVNNVYFSTPYFDARSQNELSKKFVEAYLTTFGSKPEVFAAHAYEAMNLTLKAIMAVGNNSERIKKYLLENSFQGVTTKFSFNEKGDVIKPIAIYKALDNNFILVKKVGIINK